MRSVGESLRALVQRVAGWAAAATPERYLAGFANWALLLKIRLQERERRARLARVGSTLPRLESFDGQTLVPSILERDEAWDRVQVESCDIPGMLTPAEIRYYKFISRFYSGKGAVVELGTWLGQSTWYLLEGLRENPRFQGRLFCVDDFVWRSAWMDPWVQHSSRALPANHESFRGWFESNVAPISRHLTVRRARLGEFDGNEDVPAFEWDGGAVEMCFVDCGRLFSVNESWYRELRPHFIPGRTLLILQDWQHHKAVPEVWWEHMKLFTDSKKDELELLHEIRYGAIGTFLYTGPRGNARQDFL